MTVLVLQVTQDEAQLGGSERLDRREEYDVALSPGVESVGDGSEGN